MGQEPPSSCSWWDLEYGTSFGFFFFGQRCNFWLGPALQTQIQCKPKIRKPKVYREFIAYAPAFRRHGFLFIYLPDVV